jgi:hypothetical protein
MVLSIEPMSLSDYADQQSRLGAPVICRNGVFWRKVRPLFYRPLLPVESYTESAVQTPFAWPGGFQYVVADKLEANSTMNFIMLGDLQAYSLGGLTHKRRQLITRAAQDFEVRPLRDPDELKAQGHKVYLSFYQRTRYSYRQDRIGYRTFCQWIDTLFSSPKTILMGGYGPNGLAAISSSYWVNSTFIYSTLICESEALRRNLGELMFHEVRQLAAQHGGIRQMYVRNYHGGNSHDQYYLYRGCQLVRRPARLEIPQPFESMLRWMSPNRYARLLGSH